MPKTAKTRRVESYKLYTRKIAEDANVTLDKHAYSLLDTMIREASKTLLLDAISARSSSKLLSVGDLQTSLTITNAGSPDEALSFAAGTIAKYRDSKTDTEPRESD